jgi:DEAD/DEAH box helicase domain-containing protein
MGITRHIFEVLSPEHFPQVEYCTRLPEKAGRTAPLPEDLHPTLAARLEDDGISTLWTHQRECWDKAASASHFIVTTGTASGKSLCFNLPVLDHLLRDEHARALYLYPTKALAQDQLRRLSDLCRGQVAPAVYDGDTPAAARRAARHSARALLTNPDMLSMALLPHHEQWGDFFLNLSHVVIDEAHVYRGVFGSHVANVLRRLRRVASFYGAEPRFLLASATISNAREHAAALTGLAIPQVGGDGAPSGRRQVVIWQPPVVEERLNVRRSNLLEASEIVADLMSNGIRCICFTRSRRAAELAFQYVVDVLKHRDPPLAKRLSPYRAGYTPAQRREIERRLFNAELLAVVSTNALELGIDVGALDAVVTVGYPGTVASLWQQFGRAGRGKSDSLAVFVVGNDALEQFFARHPEQLLGREVEAATIDFANPYIHGRHLLAAAYESPLAPADQEFFGPDLPAAAEREAAGSRLRRSGDTFYITGHTYPAADIGLRSSSPDQFTIVDADTGDIIGTQEAETAFGFLHPGAVYLHIGETYLVHKLDIDGRVAAVRRHYDTYYTQPRKESTTEIVSVEMSDTRNGVRLYLGTISVSTQVIAYQKKRLGSDESLGTEELDLPLQHFVTESFWFTLPLEMIPNDRMAHRLPGALHAVEHGMISILPLLAMCDRSDIGGLSTPLHAQTELPTIFVYDGHPGGVGISRQGFTAFERWVDDTLALVVACPCELGCPSCIQSPKCGNWNEPLDKELALSLLQALSGSAQHG